MAGRDSRAAIVILPVVQHLYSSLSWQQSCREKKIQGFKSWVIQSRINLIGPCVGYLSFASDMVSHDLAGLLLIL